MKFFRANVREFLAVGDSEEFCKHIRLSHFQIPELYKFNLDFFVPWHFKIWLVYLGLSTLPQSTSTRVNSNGNLHEFISP